MLARRPAAAGEPAAETVRQQVGWFGRRLGLDAARHSVELSRPRGFVEGAAADQSIRRSLPIGAANPVLQAHASPLLPRAKRVVGSEASKARSRGRGCF